LKISTIEKPIVTVTYVALGWDYQKCGKAPKIEMRRKYPEP